MAQAARFLLTVWSVVIIVMIGDSIAASHTAASLGVDDLARSLGYMAAGAYGQSRGWGIKKT